MKVDFDIIRAKLAEAKLEPATMNDYVDKLYESTVPITGHTNPYYRLFYLLAQAFSPVNVVELGSWRCIASAHFAVGGAKNVITIDIHREDSKAQQCCWDVVQHIPAVQYLNGWTWANDIVAKVKRLAYPIDILFIDAWHEYQYAKQEWDLYTPLLADEALVICDDIMDVAGATVDMKKFWAEIEYEKFLDTSLHGGIPMGFVRYVA